MNTCEDCPNTFEPSKRGAHRRFCDDCRLARQRAAAPERNRRYRVRHLDDFRSREAAFRASEEGKALVAAARDRYRFGGLKAAVLERDGYQCTVCRAPWIKGSRSIIVHHLDHDRTHNVMDNLITMCRSCHPKIHGADRPWVRKKISDAVKRAWDEGRKKPSTYRATPEHRAHMSALMRGRKTSAETAQKISEAKRQWWAQFTPAERAERFRSYLKR